MTRIIFIFIYIFLTYQVNTCAQNLPVRRSYIISAISVKGALHVDKDIIILAGGLRLGQSYTIGGDEGVKAIRNLWKQGLFGDIKIIIDSIVENKIYLCYDLEEKPRLSKVLFNRVVTKSHVEKLNELLSSYKGKVLTDEVQASISRIITNYYNQLGYLDFELEFLNAPDSNVFNSVISKYSATLGKKSKISSLVFVGNKNIDSRSLAKKTKNSRPRIWWNPFRKALFDFNKLDEDILAIYNVYQAKGYRDVSVSVDTGRLFGKNYAIRYNIIEGQKYFIRNISLEGNTVYPDTLILSLLNFKFGDIYDRERLLSNIEMDANGRDVKSLYMDNGYLFFQISCIESKIENDSVDLLLRIVEGSQASIRNILVTGNTKTSDHVVLREIRTKPGQKFSRSDIIRTTRELSQLGYFDAEQMGVVPTPIPQDGSVDIEYKVSERSNDQVELSGGWGANQIVGSLGLVLNNFSVKKILDPKSWDPVPSGDGQRLSVRVQSNGRFFQSYNFSFTEPWLGGKQPNSLTLSGYVSVQVPNGLPRSDSNRQSITIRGISLSYGKRLKKPDDYFTIIHSINFQQFELVKNFSTVFFPNGISNNFFIKETISRSSVDQLIFPRSGSNVSLSFQITPPYSYLSGMLGKTQSQDVVRWTEYYKSRLDFVNYSKIIDNLILMTRFQFGWLGTFSRVQKNVPFGRFYLGGDGIMGFNLDDRELIGLRGYENNSLTPNISGNLLGANSFQKYTMELRYPLSLNPSATIYVTSFVEAGNSFLQFSDFNPFYNFRSAGFGVRVYLPMFGLLGVDWGYGFDTVPNNLNAGKGNIHISINQNF